MAWIEDKIAEWTRKLANGEQVPDEVCRYLHIPELFWKKWQHQRPKFVAGSDEVGYGALAGPLVVCAVCAPYEWTMKGLKDSKAFPVGERGDEQRSDFAMALHTLQNKGVLRYALVSVDAARIDELGVGVALRKAHCTALEAVCSGLPRDSEMRVADGSLQLPGREVSIPKADTFIPQVMAASIIAKNARDNFMKDMAPHFPSYGFEVNKGYGTEQHLQALRTLGLCPLHRRSYRMPGNEVGTDVTDE